MQSSLRCHERNSLSSSNYNHRIQIQSYIQKTIPTNIKTKCPIKKIIRILNSMLKLNMFQCSMVCWLVKKTNVEVKIKQLEHYQLGNIQILNQPFQKLLLLFMLLNGYHVKTNFLFNGNQVDIDPIILDHIPNFRQIYRQWKPQKSIKNISLLQIHHIFENWNQNQSFTNKGKIDYNKIVDKILILSKTYNVGNPQQNISVKQTNTFKPQKNNQYGNKKRKLNQNSQPKIRYVQQKQLIQPNASPMKNSVSNKIPWFQDNNDMMQLRRSQRTINRSMYDELRFQDPISNPNPNLFQSFRSQQSRGMLDSLRNTNNRQYFNLNNSFVNLNNQSIGGGFGNMFKSSLESDFLQVNETNMKKSFDKKKQKELPGLKLKPTISFDEIK